MELSFLPTGPLISPRGEGARGIKDIFVALENQINAISPAAGPPTPSGPGQVGGSGLRQGPTDPRGPAAASSDPSLSWKSASSTLSLAYTCERWIAGHKEVLLAVSSPLRTSSPELGPDEAGAGEESGGLALPPVLRERLKEGRAARRPGPVRGDPSGVCPSGRRVRHP